MREKIISTAKNLFSQYGYFNVSMNQIARKLKVTKPALYYYFSNKQKIFKEILKEIFQDLDKIIQKSQNEKTPQAKIKKFIEEYIKFIKREDLFVKLNSFFFPSPELKRYYQSHKESFLKKVNHLFEAYLKEDKKNYFKAYPTFIMAIIERTAKEDIQKADTKGLAKNIWEFFFKGRK